MPAGSNLVKVKASHIFLERHAILQAERDRDGEVVHHRAEGGAFLVHVDEDLAEAAVVEFAGAQIDLVAADDRLLGVALAAVRQLLAVAVKPLDDALDDLFGDLRGACCGRRRDQRLDASSSSSSSSSAISEALSGCDSLEPSR